jgi:hypothetical protein
VSRPRLLRDAALEVLRATDAYRDALNGQGHAGPHDRYIHFDPCTDLPGVEHVYDITGDCSACGGSQYGTEDDLQRAIVRLRLVVGEPLQPWEEANHGESVRAFLEQGAGT